MLLVDIRLLIILYLQNQPHSHREKDRQTYLSDVYHLVFGQFQHSDVQRWLQWTCVLFSRHQGQFTCAISCQCHVRTTIPEVFKLLLCSFYFSSRTCLVPAYLCVLEFYGDRDLILIKKNTYFPTSFGKFLSICSVVFGPKLGMRALVQCRFSWGYVQKTISIILIYYCREL